MSSVDVTKGQFSAIMTTQIVTELALQSCPLLCIVTVLLCLSPGELKTHISRKLTVKQRQLNKVPFSDERMEPQ